MVSRFRSRLTYLAGVAIGGALCCLAVNSLPADAADRMFETDSSLSMGLAAGSSQCDPTAPGGTG
jgi:hypothetical protein